MAFERAIVIGGSMAGLTAAGALATRFDEVMIVERRKLPDSAPPASIAPQGAMPHLLLAGGAAALERLLPGLMDDLEAHGALEHGGRERRCHWWAAGAVRRTLPALGVRVPLCSRPLVESRVRARVGALANVTMVERTAIRGLHIAAGRVRGARCERDGGEEETIDADLVVDASGRSSRSPSWIEEHSGHPIPTSAVQVGLTYTGLEVRRVPGDLDDALVAVVQNSRELARIGVALPKEGDRWSVVLGGYFGDAAEPTRTSVTDFAASLPDDAIRHLLDNEWLTEPHRYRFPSSVRTHWEKAASLPAGFVAVGDAVASFNPLYGQGMSSAALQVEGLVRTLDEMGTTDRLPRHVARRCSRVVANPWRTATGADFVYPQTEGVKPRGTDAVNRYMERVFVAAASDEVVNLALTRVGNLLAPPPTMFAPAIVRRVWRAGRQRRARATSPKRSRVDGSRPYISSPK